MPKTKTHKRSPQAIPRQLDDILEHWRKYEQVFALQSDVNQSLVRAQ
ncbi:12022_t:CDS:2, partial [Entrophospora sp. SA101]